MSSEALGKLRAVNVPDISESDFSRLYKGKLANIIDLVAQSVVGRREANIARATIQRNRDLPNSTKRALDPVPDSLYNSSKRAESRLKSTRATVDHEERTRNERLQSIQALEHDEHQLRVSLDDKRLTSLLLAILERKEKVRKERYNEIIKLLEDLRQKYKAVQETSVGSSDQTMPPDLKCTTKLIRTDFTKDVLSALQAHSLRVSRLAAQSSAQPSPSRIDEAEHRLLQAVARAKGTSVDEAEVSSTFQALRATGRKHALQRVQYRSPIPSARETEDMHVITQRISETEKELQHLADHSAALTLACAQALQVASHFTHEAAPSLRDSLQDESNNAQGHVDILRLSIVNRPRQTPSRPAGESLSKGQTLSATISNLERNVKRAQASEAFVRDVEQLISPEPSAVEEQASVIDSFNTEEAKVADRITRLLERKAKKAAVGQDLVEDIERLVAETASIAGGHV